MLLRVTASSGYRTVVESFIVNLTKVYVCAIRDVRYTVLCTEVRGGRNEK